MSRFLVVIAITGLVASTARAQDPSQAARATEAAAAEQQRHQQEMRAQATRLVASGLDPARMRTVGLWPGRAVPCKLPVRDKPYTCHRLVEGPALILSELTVSEIIVARGDAALARGERIFWLNNQTVMPLALAPGDVLYVVGDKADRSDTDVVATLYR